MDHAGNNVFAGSALSLNEHGDIRCRDLVHTGAQRLHAFATSENDRLGRNLSN
jgi:hypothetical protein